MYQHLNSCSVMEVCDWSKVAWKTRQICQCKRIALGRLVRPRLVVIAFSCPQSCGAPIRNQYIQIVFNPPLEIQVPHRDSRIRIRIRNTLSHLKIYFTVKKRVKFICQGTSDLQLISKKENIHSYKKHRHIIKS